MKLRLSRPPAVLAVLAVLAVAMPACAIERRGFAWNIGASMGPAVPPAASLAVPTATLPAAGCCSAGSVPLSTPLASYGCTGAPLSLSYGCTGGMPMQALPVSVAAPVPSYGCCGGGGGLSVQYLTPQPQAVYQAVYQAPQPAIYAAAPSSCPSPATASYVGHLQAVNSALGSASGSTFAQQAATAPMSNQELTEHLLEMAAILDRLSGVTAEHAKALKRGTGARSPAPAQPAGGP